MKLSKKCIGDTNVPITANLAFAENDIPEELDDCVEACSHVIEHVINMWTIVMDAGDEIFSEYHTHLSMKGRPGIGDCFMKWVHDNRWGLPEEDRVPISVNGDSRELFQTDCQYKIYLFLNG